MQTSEKPRTGEHCLLGLTWFKTHFPKLPKNPGVKTTQSLFTTMRPGGWNSETQVAKVVAPRESEEIASSVALGVWREGDSDKPRALAKTLKHCPVWFYNILI